MTGPLRESYRYCGEVSRREAKNFYYSFLLLPPSRRRAMCALYAFMRRTDDLADEPDTVEAKRAALEGWRRELDEALGSGAGMPLTGAPPPPQPSPTRGEGVPVNSGVAPERSFPPSPLVGEGWGGGTREPKPIAPPTTAAPSTSWPGFPALVDTIRAHQIPPKYFHEAIDGVSMDLEPRPFATFDDLYAYCYRVASVVGLCCIHIWGYRSEGGRAEALSEACGVALQLTNILRDVREDAQLGRIYLPIEDLARFGVSPEELREGPLNDRVRALLAFEGRRAYDYYERAMPLMGLVDPVGRPALGAIVGIYRALLDEIARRGYDVLGERVAIPSRRKVAIALGALGGWFARPRPVPAESTTC